MTSSNTAARGLVLLNKYGSNFLHYIYSRQMVKIVCASQQYVQCDIFLVFTCNTINRLVQNQVVDD